jgi:hypothetical protein
LSAISKIRHSWNTSRTIALIAFIVSVLVLVLLFFFVDDVSLWFNPRFVAAGSLWGRGRSTRQPSGGRIYFPPSPTSLHSIGLLSQCTQVSGVRYFIAKDVASGQVEFGHTNTLLGSDWVSAFMKALETAKPEWYDPGRGAFRKENLVFITNRTGTILVMPKEMAVEYRSK